MVALVWAAILLFTGMYLGWKAGAAATTERFRQEEQNRLTLTKAIEEEKRKVRSELRAEAKARKQGNFATVT